LRQLADGTHAGPSLHVVLGDEARVQEAAQQHNVEMRNMVADEQRATAAARHTVQLDPDSQRAAQATEPQPRQHESGPAAGESHQQPLRWHQHDAGEHDESYLALGAQRGERSGGFVRRWRSHPPS
jgi:hypothetical protein